MRISELSRATGVPVATIKYYLREGLLFAGSPTARNQADYDDRHVRRLRLIRVLVEVGGLGLAAVHDVLDALDDPRIPMHRLLGVAHHKLQPRTRGGDSPDLIEALSEVDRFLSSLRWRTSAEAPSRRDLAAALAALRRLGWHTSAEVFAPYARVADKIAAREVGQVPAEGSRAESIERVVVGTVVFEAALVALRRLAQEHHSALRFSSSRRSRSQPRSKAREER